MFKKLIAMTFLSAGILLGGCGLEVYQSGDLPSEARLNSIQVGKSTKEQTLRILGAPVFASEQGNFLVYGKIRKESQAFMEPKEFERDIYVLTFNKENILTDKEHLTMKEGNNVSYVSATTPTKHKELSVTEQLIKNFGRYDAGGRDSTQRR